LLLLLVLYKQWDFTDADRQEPDRILKNFRIFYRFGFCDTCCFGEASVIEV